MNFVRDARRPRRSQVDAIGLGAVFALMAVGIGLVFGVMRLVNFAYGQLIMAGAFALAFASERDWPVGGGIALCFAVVLALSLAMERVVFRPLRGQSAAVMLVATFAVAFLLQSIALLWFGPLGKTATSLVAAQPAGRRSAASTSARSRSSRSSPRSSASRCSSLLLNRTSIGLHMRAAAIDSQTARLLGVRAELVSGVAVLIAGALAAVVAVILTVQFPTVTPTFALKETILVLVGVVVGGMTASGPRRSAASHRLRVGPPRRRAAVDQSQYLPSVVFGLVILVLLLRPGRALRARPSASWSAYESRDDAAVELARAGAARRRRRDRSASFVSHDERDLLPDRARLGRDRRRDLRLRRQLRRALVRADQLLRGRRLGRGRDDRPARGREAGDDARPLPTSCATTTVGNVPSLVLAAAVGGVFAFLVGLPLMRLSGSRGRDRDVRRARDHAQPPALLDEDRARRNTLSLVPETTGPAAGDARRGARHRGRVRLPAEPARTEAPRDARGSRRRAGGGDQRLPAAAVGVHALRLRSPASPAACSCTFSARSRPSRSTSS